MRSDRELLNLVLGALDKHSNYLCNAISGLHHFDTITLQEGERLLDIIWTEKPTKYKHPEFFNHDNYRKTTITRDNGGVWWGTNNESGYTTLTQFQENLQIIVGQKKLFIAKLIEIYS